MQQDAVTLSAELAYNGESFHGFARQEGLETVQGCLEDALHVLFKQPIETVCAGRTDAGVHARGQVISFEVARDWLGARELPTLARSLNALTPSDIAVRSVQERPAGFSARFNAKSREYRYFLSTQSAPPLVMHDFCWHVPGELDVTAMRKASNYLKGEHDFKSFCLTSSAQGRSTIRSVLELSLDPVEIAGDELVRVRIVGTAFLHSMVRTVVGTLVLVGRGLREPDWVRRVLEARTREAAGQTAPAKGLIFWKVEY